MTDGMSEGAMLVWFILTGLSLLFVVFDIPSTPEHPVIRWAFIILVIFTGPLGAFFYVLGCREPLKSTHEAYVAAQWRQVLGSTMHCAAGDGLGIIAGAAIAALMHFSGWADLALEYALGFGFGWAIFQALAMRDMAGGSYLRSLRLTFLPEFLSMNLLMGGMVATASLLMPKVNGGGDPSRPGFWFVMSMALIVGFIFAYPMNWWLVGNGLKHGMFTIRKDREPSKLAQGTPHPSPGHLKSKPSALATTAMVALSLLILGLGIAVSRLLAG